MLYVVDDGVRVKKNGLSCKHEVRFYMPADDGNRTRDLRLTKATLYRLSHISIFVPFLGTSDMIS